MTLLPTEPPRVVPTRPADDAEVLFKEAHQRRRRRRRLLAGVFILVVAAAATGVAVVVGGSHPHNAGRVATPARTPLQNVGTTQRIAWVDYQRRVHIGNLQTHQQQVVATGGGDATTPLVASGNTLFWVSGNVMAYDVATGHVRTFARGGLQVFNAVGSTDVYVESGDLARYRLDGRLVERFRFPDGWYLADAELAGDPSPALADGGILVQSQTTISAETAGAKPSRLAVWTPATGSIRPLGDVWKVVATYTDIRSATSLVAWLPATCLTSDTCLLQLTDVGTGATDKIRSPLGFGFDFGGAFSPNGRQLAVFAESNSGDYNPETRLALIDVARLSLRLVPGATIKIGDSLAWANWLPGSRQLFVGGLSGKDGSGSWPANQFRVDSETLHSTPIRFLADANQNVNYSVVVLP
jgi:hypothetical protein